ncbi:MAG: hypothetical protein IJT87_10900 [Ruminiclostridium sp.]|nr:hypothetical protein [Ruminiclostridium sp.]
MADENKKITDEVKENIENTQEGAVTDEEAENVAGGLRIPSAIVDHSAMTIDPIKTGNDNNR